MKTTLLALLAILSACGGGNGSGRAQAFVVAEDTIPDGLEAGDGLENIQDGWSVTYDKFLAVVGDFRAGRQSGGATQRSEDIYVLDMKALPTSGFVIADFDDLDAARWDKVGYDMPRASQDALCPEFTSGSDCAFMQLHGFSIYFEATMTKPGGESCLRTGTTPDCVAAPVVRFVFGMQSGTTFDDCSDQDDVPGFAVPTGGTVQVKPTIHGDHWFFDNISQGAEVTTRQAQWIADADRSNPQHTSDGLVTFDELRASPAGAFFPSSRGYNLSGTLVPVVNALTFFEAQAHTLGDYQGEGECPTREVLQ